MNAVLLDDGCEGVMLEGRLSHPSSSGSCTLEEAGGGGEEGRRTQEHVKDVSIQLLEILAGKLTKIYEKRNWKESCISHRKPSYILYERHLWSLSFAKLPFVTSKWV